MFQLNDDFLKELGLGDLPAEQKQAFLEHIYSELETRVGMRLSEGLSDAQLQEFESFMERDETKVKAWLDSHVNGYQQDPAYSQLASGVPENTPEIVILSEYASLKWLSMNRPDYREVVRAVLDELKKEIMSNRDAILDANSGAGDGQNTPPQSPTPSA